MLKAIINKKESSTKLKDMYDFLYKLGVTPNNLKEIEVYDNEQKVEVNLNGYSRYFKQQLRTYLVTFEDGLTEHIRAYNQRQMKEVIAKNNLKLTSYKIISVAGEVVYEGI